MKIEKKKLNDPFIFPSLNKIVLTQQKYDLQKKQNKINNELVHLLQFNHLHFTFIILFIRLNILIDGTNFRNIIMDCKEFIEGKIAIPKMAG